MRTLQTMFKRHRADVIMSVMVFIWGFHFIVVKDAVGDMNPLTYNAVRFTIGLPALALFALRDRAWLHVSRHDMLLLFLLTVTGPLLYQIGFALGIKRTTSANTALLVATMPAWTAFFSIALGLVEIRRRLLLGIAITLTGMTLVVLSRSRDGLSLSHDDLAGSALVLGAAALGGLGNVTSKPVVDRVGGMTMAIWKYIWTTVGLLMLSAPQLAHFSADTLPLHNVPNVLYSGILSGVGGYLAVHIALKDIGPTRTSAYFNYNPIVASAAGVLILGEPLTVGLLIGGALTLWGVAVVRRNTYLRKKAPAAGEPTGDASPVVGGAQSARVRGLGAPPCAD